MFTVSVEYKENNSAVIILSHEDFELPRKKTIYHDGRKETFAAHIHKHIKQMMDMWQDEIDSSKRIIRESLT